MSFRIQFDGQGRYRIHRSPKAGQYPAMCSPWAAYNDLAIFRCPSGKTYIAGSEYGLLPMAHQVYELVSRVTNEGLDLISGEKEIMIRQFAANPEPKQLNPKS